MTVWYAGWSETSVWMTVWYAGWSETSVWMTVWYAGCSETSPCVPDSHPHRSFTSPCIPDSHPHRSFTSPCIPDTHPHSITSTKCRINTVVSPDNGHIVARHMCRKYTKNKLCTELTLFVLYLLKCQDAGHNSVALCSSYSNITVQFEWYVIILWYIFKKFTWVATFTHIVICLLVGSEVDIDWAHWLLRGYEFQNIFGRL